jgi:hypothetical protein
VLETSAGSFQRYAFAVDMALSCQPGFSAASGAADIFPFRFDGYFLKAPMRFAYKLINWHSLCSLEEVLEPLLAKTSYWTHTPLSVLSAKRFDFFRSGFKASDQVQGQGAGRSRKRSPANGGMSKYIYRRSATQPLGLRWGFETTSGFC